MRHDRGARPADVLRHPDVCIRHLGITALAAQLLHHFDQLVYAGRADWMAACLQPAAGGDGDAPGGKNVAIQPQADPLTAPGKTAKLLGCVVIRGWARQVGQNPSMVVRRRIPAIVDLAAVMCFLIVVEL